MPKFSANLGFLWTDRELPAAIIAAKDAGFDAVECHWPYDTPAKEIMAALNKTDLRMLGLNTRRGNIEAGENGLSALPDRIEEARAAIDEAISYATQIHAQNIHVMSGNTQGEGSRAIFINNLQYACSMAAKHNITILIEPLNRHDAPDYFLNNLKQAKSIIKEINIPNLKLMFDCYHVGRTEGNVIANLNEMLPIIGHIQFASVPDRGAPDHGEVNYSALFKEIDRLGWKKPLGAEYRPNGNTNNTLGWMRSYT